MLESITIENFRSHEETTLSLAPGITAIIGSSDTGKSNIMRAIYWLTENRPLGSDMVSFWARDAKGEAKEPCRVTFHFSDGTPDVVRVRSREENAYYLGEMKLEAMKTAVPDPVLAALNLSEVNVGKQFDSPFLVGDSGGDIAKFLNGVIKLDAIDRMLSSIDGKKRSVSQEIARLEGQIAERERELAAYGWVDEAAEVLEEYERVSGKLEERKRSLLDLAESISSYTLLEDTLSAADRILSAEHLLSEYRTLSRTRDTHEEALLALSRTVRQYEALTAELSPFPFEEVEQILGDWKAAYTRAREYRQSLSTLSSQIEEYRRREQELITIKEDQFIAEQKRPAVCPLCGAAMRKEEEA